MRLIRTIIVAAALLAAVGCETDSWLDPSVVGRWEPTPVVMPILDQLDIIDEPPAKAPGTTQVRAGDLVEQAEEYVVGPGDLLTFTVFELIMPNVETVQTRRVDELGYVRLPVLGSMRVAGYSPSMVERRIRRTLEEMDQLKDAEVSVIVQEGRQNTFSVIGEPRVSGTGIGTYTIPHPNFRLMAALALARGVPGQVKTLYVIRGANNLQARIADDPNNPDAVVRNDEPVRSADEQTIDLIDSLAASLQKGDNVQGFTPGADAPSDNAIAMNQPVAQADATEKWIHVDGQWQRMDMAANVTAAGTVLPTQPRIIEVPYDRLRTGDMRYNIVVQPGDIIRVPAPVIGNVYIGGSINRPGTYALPGDKDLTLKQLIFAAGNLAPTAIPERVDLIRRVGNDNEATVRLDLREIFNGTQPDFYLKPNDTVNVGTNFVATPLAVVRNGFRATYGFGFVLDRNFEGDVFGNVNNN